MELEHYTRADQIAQAMRLLESQGDEWQFDEFPFIALAEFAPGQDSLAG
jgi:hypothetical protein